jgi:hypothetical protein
MVRLAHRPDRLRTIREARAARAARCGPRDHAAGGEPRSGRAGFGRDPLARPLPDRPRARSVRTDGPAADPAAEPLRRLLDDVRPRDPDGASAARQAAGDRAPAGPPRVEPGPQDARVVPDRRRPPLRDGAGDHRHAAGLRRARHHGGARLRPDQVDEPAAAAAREARHEADRRAPPGHPARRRAGRVPHRHPRGARGREADDGR